VLNYVLQCAAAYHHFIAMLHHRYYSSWIHLCYSVLQYVAVRCSVL